jgi:hypothetical protein
MQRSFGCPFFQAHLTNVRVCERKLASRVKKNARKVLEKNATKNKMDSTKRSRMKTMWLIVFSINSAFALNDWMGSNVASVHLYRVRGLSHPIDLGDWYLAPKGQ